jgi:hypothetical protein
MIQHGKVGDPMNITSNTPRPKPTGNQRSGCITWIFLLLILLVPARNILPAILHTVAPQMSTGQLWLILGGIAALGVVVTSIARAVRNRPVDTQLPTALGPDARSPLPGGTQIRPSRPQIPSSSVPGYSAGPPRFEPIITGKVVVAGFVLAALLAGAGLLLITTLGAHP